MNKETECIKHLSGAIANSCSCNSCKNMCKATPCLGTPEDILMLMNAGHSDKLSPTQWLTGALLKVMPAITMIQPEFDKTKQSCAFLSAEGLCSLHDSGLKPTEGKLASCTSKKDFDLSGVRKQLTFVVAERWLLESNYRTMNTVIKGYVKYFQGQNKSSIKNGTFYLPAAVDGK